MVKQTSCAERGWNTAALRCATIRTHFLLTGPLEPTAGGGCGWWCVMQDPLRPQAASRHATVAVWPVLCCCVAWLSWVVHVSLHVPCSMLGVTAVPPGRPCDWLRAAAIGRPAALVIPTPPHPPQPCLHTSSYPTRAHLSEAAHMLRTAMW